MDPTRREFELVELQYEYRTPNNKKMHSFWDSISFFQFYLFGFVFITKHLRSCQFNLFPTFCWEV